MTVLLHGSDHLVLWLFRFYRLIYVCSPDRRYLSDSVGRTKDFVEVSLPCLLSNSLLCLRSDFPLFRPLGCTRWYVTLSKNLVLSLLPTQLVRSSLCERGSQRPWGRPPLRYWFLCQLHRPSRRFSSPPHHSVDYASGLPNHVSVDISSCRSTPVGRYELNEDILCNRDPLDSLD